MTYVLVIWLHIQGYPLMIEPYNSFETCKQAADMGRKQHNGDGFWFCIPKDEKP